MHLYEGSWCGAPEASEFIKSELEKSIEISNFLKICMNSERIFYIKMRILRKSKVRWFNENL